jgi:hypothetical protein
VIVLNDTITVMTANPDVIEVHSIADWDKVYLSKRYLLIFH